VFRSTNPDITPFPNGWTVFEASGVEKSLPFPELALAVSVEESMKGRVFFPHGAGSLAARQETRKHRLLTLGGTFTVLLGLRDPSPNYTRQIQIRFGATSWGKSKPSTLIAYAHRNNGKRVVPS
jgi:hypothetical protein